MRLDLVTALRLSLDGEIVDAGNEPELAVIALIDRRGRRLLVPIHGRSQRYRRSSRSTAACLALRIDTTVFSGTIH